MKTNSDEWIKSKSFKRNLSSDLINKLQKEPLYIDYLKADIFDHYVFPTIRINNIGFYYRGGLLFKYDKEGFHTHIKYAAAIEKENKNYLTEKELGNYKLATNFSKNYSRIKENCSVYSGVEATGVSDIYNRYSYVGRSSGIVVLDIEVSLKSLNKDNNQDRIDILLYNINERKLKFVEAKHYSNSEIWSKYEAKVIRQIKRYEEQIKIKKAEIISEYNQYIGIINNLFGGELPLIEDVAQNVVLLIFGFDNDQKNGRLKTLITKNSRFKDMLTFPIGNVDQIKLNNLWKKTR
ncbi:MAG TPA: hypothetical protein PLM65_00015 [Smithella sp.]|nr:hypothetical protein [Smithella sp.]